MPELRKDPVIGRWVIIASERARRPGNFVDTSDIELEESRRSCSFCNNRRSTIMEDDQTGVRVVSSLGSTAKKNSQFLRKKQGLYDVISGFGANEIVIETSEHVANIVDLEINQIEGVLKAYASRMKELQKDNRYQYVLAYKNYGPTAGSRKIGHTRSHIVATPVKPMRVNEKLTGAKEYFKTNGRCIYCDLIEQEIDSSQRIVCQTDHFVAVIPFAARFLFETWILPRAHHCDYAKGVKDKEEDLAKILKTLLQKIQKGLDDPAYNFVIQTAPFRRENEDSMKWTSLEQDYHWHIELMPRLTRVAGFEKGTGFYICAIPPENMATYLRDIHV